MWRASAPPALVTSAEFPIRSLSCLGGPLARRVRRRLGAVLHAQLREDAAHVVARRLLADDQRVGDPRIGHALPEQAQDLPLARGQLAVGAWARRRAGAEL